MSSSDASLHLLQAINSRRLLLHKPFFHSQGEAPPPSNKEEYTFDANVVMVLSVLLCGLICAIGLNSIIRCALRCSRHVPSESGENVTNRPANKGIKKKTLKTFPTLIYSAELKPPGSNTECIICLSEFTFGECLRILPKCNHGFHIQCIDKWLESHSSCPTCRHCLIDTCQKIGRSQVVSSETLTPLPVIIAPLEPEGLIPNYRVVC